MLTMTTLRPGLLVSLNTSVRGNCAYTKETIRAEHVTEAGTQEAEWNTKKVVADPQEHEAALKVRSRASYLLRAVCANSAFGLLCPEDKVDALKEAVAEARKLADQFNASAKLTRVQVLVITGRIAADDVEAVRAINSEVRGLLDAMSDGIRAMDVKAIREAAEKAKSIGQMLSEDARSRIATAVTAAREAATKINKAGETAAVEVDRFTLTTLQRARTAFLDLEEGTEVIAPRADARAVDFDPVVDAPAMGSSFEDVFPAPVVPQFEM